MKSKLRIGYYYVLLCIIDELLFCICDFNIPHFRVLDSGSVIIGSAAADKLNLLLTGNAAITFHSVDHNEACDLTKNTIFDDILTSFIVQQNKLPDAQTILYYVANPSTDWEASLMNPDGSYKSTITLVDKEFPPGRHSVVSPIAINTLQDCVFGLSLTDSKANQLGYVSYKEALRVINGFDLKFTAQFLHNKQECSKQTCEPLAGHGISLILHSHPLPVIGSGGAGLGYEGLKRVLAIELDLVGNSEFSDPVRPHVSVQFKPGASEPVTPHFADTVGFAFIPDIGDGSAHKVQIVYFPDIGKLDTRKNKFQVLKQIDKYLDSSKSENWLTEHQLGVLVIFVDNMDTPVLSLPANLGKMIEPFAFRTPNPTTGETDGSEGGKAHLTIAGTTDEKHASRINILGLSFASTPKCTFPSTPIKCSKSNTFDLNTKRTLKIRNIGRRAIYLQAKYKVEGGENGASGNGDSDGSPNSNSNSNPKSWATCFESDIRLEPSSMHQYWDPCILTLEIDANIVDIGIFDYFKINTAYFTSVFNTISNPYFLTSHTHICARLQPKPDGTEVMEVGMCNCETCVNFFELSRAFGVREEYRHTCNTKFGGVCPCFEVSRLGLEYTSEDIQFQEHTICKECKYDSHCSLLLPGAFCNSQSLAYRVGNPFNPTPTNHGFTDWLRDSGHVTNGLIKGDSCDCSPGYSQYLDSYQGSETYNVFPRYNILNLGNCIRCLQDPFKSELDCLPDCGTGVTISAHTYPSGQKCSTCLLSGEPFQELKQADKDIIKKCISDTKALDLDPFIHCRENIISEDFSRIYIGLLSHFLAECPSKPISNITSNENSGAVCIPYYNFNTYTMNKAISIKSVRGTYPSNYECMNSHCQVSRKETCVDNSDNCVCYDTCPLGLGWFGHTLKALRIPCSGNGVCRYTGHCICLGGYVGDNCEKHCSMYLGGDGCCANDLHCTGGLICTLINAEGIGVCTSS